MSQRDPSGRRVKRKSFLAATAAVITMVLASLGFATATAAANVPSGTYTGLIGQSTERYVTFPVSNGHIGEIDAQTYMYCGGWPAAIYWGDNPDIPLADDGSFNAEYWIGDPESSEGVRFRVSGAITSDGVATGELKVNMPNMEGWCAEGTEPFTAYLEAPAYDPEIAIAPNVVTQTELATDGVRVTGSGFPESSTVEFSFDGTSAGSTTTDANGALDSTVVANLDPGNYTLTASTGSESAQASLTVDSDPVDPLDPEISVSPGSLTVSELENGGLTVTGADFPAGSDVEVTIGGQSAATTTTNNSGTFETTASASVTPGTHTVTATSGDYSATGTVTVTEDPVPLDPEISVSPEEVTVSQLAEDGIVVSGTDYPATEAVEITIGEESVGTATADANGAFTTTVTGNFDPNTYTVTATNGSFSSTATLTVVADELEPVLAVQPDEVSEEQLRTEGIIISGSDFPAHSTVELSIGDVDAGSATTDASGVFSHMATADIAAGTYTVTAASGGYSASATLTVVGEAWDPQLTVTPTELTQSELAEQGVEIAASGFRADESLLIEINGELWHEVTTDAEGSATVTLTRDVRPGEYDITVRQSWMSGGGWLSALQALDATVTITVTEDAPPPTDPEVQLSRDTVTVSELADGLGISGSGFEPGEELTIEFDGEVALTLTADDNGEFSTTIALRGIEPGEYEIVVRAASGSANTQVMVVADEPEPSEPEIELEKSTVTVAELAAGVGVTGSGFASDEELTIEFDGGAIDTTVAAADGTVAGTLSIPDAEPGEHVITIRGASGEASATLTVTDDDSEPEPSEPEPSDPEPSAPEPTDPEPSDGDGNRDDNLPRTGSGAALTLIGLAALVMFGGAVLTISARRRSEG